MPLETWAGRPVASLRNAWQVPRLVAFDRVGSTNDIARTLAEGGAAELTTVLAELQTAGRGRFGRTWTAPHGSALLMSIVLRPAGGPDAAPSAAALRVGLAAAHAIGQAAGVDVRLKWPNDLQARDGAKLGGVLCEAVTGATGSFVIAGIGINVNQTVADFAPELREIAASLRGIAGREIDRVRLAHALIDALRPRAAAIDRPLDRAERDAWERRDALRGQAVHVDDEPAGTADGVTAQGALRLRTSRGPRLLWSGTVRPSTPANAGGKGTS